MVQLVEVAAQTVAQTGEFVRGANEGAHRLVGVILAVERGDEGSVDVACHFRVGNVGDSRGHLVMLGLLFKEFLLLEITSHIQHRFARLGYS